MLEIGYQRNYSPIYQAAYEGIVTRRRAGRRLHGAHRLAPQRQLAPQRRAARRRTTIRRSGATRLGALLNWRLYKKYSRGLIAELGSHQVNITNWFFGSTPEAVIGTGGIYRFAMDGARSTITCT